MFNIGFAELMLILLVAFVIVGPKDLPKVARALARAIKYLKQMFEDFKEEMGLDETLEELRDVERDVGNTLREANPAIELKQTQREAEELLRGAAKDAKKGLDVKSGK